MLGIVVNDIVIIGAGLSGLTAARHLRASGHQVLLLDKGSRPGGRMATRSFEGAIFDYGAQFFTVREPAFQNIVDEWQAAGLVRVWSHGFGGNKDGHPRYIGVPGANAIPAYLAKGLDIRTGTKVSHVSISGNEWVIETDFDEQVYARSLLITCPVPQTLALLDVELPAAEQAALERVSYDRCLALMALLEEPMELPEPGALQEPDGEPICWIADNTRKGISALAHAVTIHAGPRYSEENWESPAEEVAEDLLGGRKATAWKLHRWKYARPRVYYPEPSCVLHLPLPLVLAGDAFGQARVEGAVLSGLSAAARFEEQLSPQL